MSDKISSSVLRRKSEMYAMIISIEEDFISNFSAKLTLDDIPPKVLEKSKKVTEEKSVFLSVLRGLDIQSYIEICNANLVKLHINSEQKDFLNTNLQKIIKIRNAIMHPRPLEYFDYSTLKTVFDNISYDLSCFDWDSVSKAHYQIENNPDSLTLPPNSLKKNERIIENLPSLLDYEETSFVGRQKEIAEIRAQLKRNNVHILSIIGDGGVGKTATTLKLLYDMLDDVECPYELIVWTSLKTNELSDDDFCEIADSIKTTAQMYEQLASFVGSENISDTKRFIIELAQNFNMLLVLDNLETINTADIKDYIDEFSEFGKVLITSRIGLGEMEHRYKLSGLNENDVLEYTDRLLELYGFECYFTDEHKKDVVIEKLHSNPLAIKWFVRCLYNGQSEDEILAHKEDVINFCMANVYEKLSDDAHKVLEMLTVAGVQLSFAELMYYLEANVCDCTKIKYAINELGKCNFIDEEKFKRDKNIAVTEFAHEFLMLHYSDVRHLIVRFKELEQKLTSFGQHLLILKSEDNLDINSIHYQNRGELVAAMLLTEALATTKENAFEIIKYAQELVPLYYENNLILARIYGIDSPLKAAYEYKSSAKYCKSPNELVRVYIQHTDFLIRMNDYQNAIQILDEAEKLNVNITEVRIQKAKILSYIGQFDLAEETLDAIEFDTLSNPNKNKVITRRADIHRRRSELVDIRETQKRLIHFNEAYRCFEKCIEPDDKVFEYIAKILDELSYMFMDEDALKLILEIVHEHYQEIKRTAHYKDFREQMSLRITQIQNESFVKEISRYIIDFNTYLHLLDINEAVIYNLKEGYGFCKNKDNPQGLYFSKKGLDIDVNYGDILSFTAIYNSKGRLSVINPKKVDNIEERIARLS